MSVFGGLIFTNVGRNLQAKAQAGAQLTFTRIVVGDGDLGGSSIADLTALKHQVKSLSITKLMTLTGGKAVVGTVFSNQDIVSGFYWRELGVFAQDPDLGEILYCYGNAGVNAEYIPATGGPDILEKSIDCVTIVGNASSVSATIESSLVYASAQDLSDLAGAGRTTETVKGVSDSIGDKATLLTTDKDSIVSSVNELFTFANDGKTAVANAITAKGISALSTDTFATLATKIGTPSLVNTADATAIANQILAGAYAYVNGAKITGTIPERGAGGTVTPSGSTQTKLAGRYTSDITISAVSVPVANVKTGTTIAGQAGTMPDRAGDTVALSSSVSGTTLKLLASNGHRDGVDDNVTTTDANFVEENIKKDVAMFGKVGTLGYSTITIPLVAGTFATITSSSGMSTSTVYVKIKEFRITQSGTVRVSFMFNGNSNGAGYARIYKNGVAIGIEKSTGYTSLIHTEYFSVSANDLIQLYIKNPNGYNTYVTHLSISVHGTSNVVYDFATATL